MAKFYHGQDSIGKYWINLDHVSYVKLEKDKLILKMLNNINVLIDGDDVIPLSQIFWNETLNWEEEYDDKRYNHEDIPSREEVMQDEQIDYDWQCAEDEDSDLERDDEDGHDFFSCTRIGAEESEF